MTAGEPYIPGHFPSKPVMPGVLILESMAQTAAAMLMSKPELKGRLAYFAGIDEARFRRQVVPGDVLKLHIEIAKIRGKICMVNGRAFVGDEAAAEAKLIFVVD